MTPEEALRKLHESAYSERNALVFYDNGRSVAMLAEAAGVTVTYVHVNLSALTTERRTVEPKEANDGRDNAF